MGKKGGEWGIVGKKGERVGDSGDNNVHSLLVNTDPPHIIYLSPIQL